MQKEKEKRQQSMPVCSGEDERGSGERGGESDGSRHSRRGRECERVSNREGPQAREHALHVMQSVHMAVYYALINAECKAAAPAFLSEGGLNCGPSIQDPETTSSNFNFNNK